MKRVARIPPVSAVLMFWTLLLVAALVLHAAVHTSLQDAATKRLVAVTRLKVDEIGRHLNNVRADLAYRAGGARFSQDVRTWQAAGQPHGVAERDLKRELQRFARLHDYADVSLYATGDGGLMLSSSGHGPARLAPARVAAVLANAGPLLDDLHWQDEEGVPAIRYGFADVLRSEGRPVALLRVTLDPARLLYPLIQSWPDTDVSAETLLVRREGDRVLFLNDLRHRAGSALRFDLPVIKARLPAALAVRGEKWAEGEDYRGVPVVWESLPVAGTPWFVVAKVDHGEMLATLHRLDWAMGTGLVALLGLALAWASGRGRWLKRLHESDLARLRAELTAEEKEGELQTLFNSATVGIGTLDRTLCFHRANGRLAALTSLAPGACCDGEALAEVMPRMGVQLEPAVRQVLESGAPAGNVELREPLPGESGDARHWLASLFPIRKGDATDRVGLMLVDITRQKKLELLLSFHSSILQKEAMGVMLVRAEDGHILYANPAFAALFGYAPEEMCGQPVSVLNAPGARSAEEVAADICHTLRETGTWQGSVENIRRDGSRFWTEARVAAYLHPDFGDVWVTNQWDITEQKRMEEEREQFRRREADLSRSLVTVQEEERRRLSSDLHDRIGANLGTLALNLSMLSARMPADDAEAWALLGDVRAVLEDTTLGVRDICADLRPALLDYVGLHAALDAYATQYARRTGIRVEARVRWPREGEDRTLETQVFRIVQEALGNIARHAGARTAALVVEQSPEGTEIQVSDDGEGFDPLSQEAQADVEGMGLVAMRQRAAFVGGDFSLLSRPGGGTCVRVRIPARPVPGAGAAPEADGPATRLRVVQAA